MLISELYVTSCSTRLSCWKHW